MQSMAARWQWERKERHETEMLVPEECDTWVHSGNLHRVTLLRIISKGYHKVHTYTYIQLFHHDVPAPSWQKKIYLTLESWNRLLCWVSPPCLQSNDDPFSFPSKLIKYSVVGLNPGLFWQHWLVGMSSPRAWRLNPTSWGDGPAWGSWRTAYPGPRECCAQNPSPARRTPRHNLELKDKIYRERLL